MATRDILVLIFGGALIGTFAWAVLVFLYAIVTGTEMWPITPLEALIATAAGAALLAKDYDPK